MMNGGETYRLENLVQLRQAEEESAQRALVAAQEALSARCRARDDALAVVGAAEQQLWDAEQKVGATGPSDAATLLRRRHFVQRRSNELTQAQMAAQRCHEAVERAEIVVARAQEELARCLRDRKALEEHRVRWEDRRRRDADRRQQGALDELAGAAHARKESDT